MTSQNTNPITLVTSPTGETSPATPEKTSPPTPRGKAPPPVQYRIEERRRTIFLTSSIPPDQWDPKTIENLLTLPDAEDGATSDAQTQTQRQRRSKSLNETELIVLTDTSNQKIKDPASISPRSYRQVKNLGVPRSGGSSSTPTTPTVNIRSGSPRTPTRHRILFYHRHDPHYGFTNFSAHPVVYQGKRYPTSEHLFQSFKVRFDILECNFQGLTENLSFKSIARILRSISERALRSLVLLLLRHADFNRKSDRTG